MNAKNQVLLLIGILMFAKAILALIRPATLRRITDWWLRTAKHVNTLTGLLYMLMGVAVFSLVLFQQPLVNWLLGLFGILLIYAGTLYFRISDLERFTRTLILNRRTSIIRLIGAVSMALAAWIIWVAITR